MAPELQEIGFGIIGCGSMGREHAANLRTLSGARLVAISDPVEDACRRLIAEDDAPHSYAGYHELLEQQDVEAVIITVPNVLHRAVTLAALAAGKHVLLEKPLAHNIEDGAAIVRAAEHSDRVVMLGFNNRFNPAALALHRAIASGRLGDLYYARARWLRREGLPPPGSWFTSRAAAGGGSLIDIGVHMLDLALHMLGYPQALSVFGVTHAHFGLERARTAEPGLFDVEDFAAGMITLANGAAVQVETSWASFIRDDSDIRLELLGTLGGACLTNDDDNPLSIFTTQDGEQVDITPRLPDFDGHWEELRAFISAIRLGSSSPVPVREGLRILEIIDAVYQSARSGDTVRIGRRS